MSRPPVVVVDTNVFGADLVRSTHRLVELYRPVLEGRRFLISFQTLAELRFGMHRRSWGERRLRRAEDHIARAEVVWPGPRLLDAYVRLRVVCELAGHALGQPEHDADRWIAATALQLGIPLVSDDRLFTGTPGLVFETAP